MYYAHGAADPRVRPMESIPTLSMPAYAPPPSMQPVDAPVASPDKLQQHLCCGLITINRSLYAFLNLLVSVAIAGMGLWMMFPGRQPSSGCTPGPHIQELMDAKDNKGLEITEIILFLAVAATYAALLLFLRRDADEALLSWSEVISSLLSWVAGVIAFIQAAWFLDAVKALADAMVPAKCLSQWLTQAEAILKPILIFVNGLLALFSYADASDRVPVPPCCSQRRFRSMNLGVLIFTMGFWWGMLGRYIAKYVQTVTIILKTPQSN